MYRSYQCNLARGGNASTRSGCSGLSKTTSTIGETLLGEDVSLRTALLRKAMLLAFRRAREAWVQLMMANSMIGGRWWAGGVTSEGAGAGAGVVASVVVGVVAGEVAGVVVGVVATDVAGIGLLWELVCVQWG